MRMADKEADVSTHQIALPLRQIVQIPAAEPFYAPLVGLRILRAALVISARGRSAVLSKFIVHHSQGQADWVVADSQTEKHHLGDWQTDYERHETGKKDCDVESVQKSPAKLERLRALEPAPSGYWKKLCTWLLYVGRQRVNLIRLVVSEYQLSKTSITSNKKQKKIEKTKKNV